MNDVDPRNVLGRGVLPAHQEQALVERGVIFAVVCRIPHQKRSFTVSSLRPISDVACDFFGQPKAIVPIK